MVDRFNNKNPEEICMGLFRVRPQVILNKAVFLIQHYDLNRL